MHMVLRQIITMDKSFVEQKGDYIVMIDLFEEAILEVELFDVSDIITASNALDEEDPLDGGL